jgi:hypothetical protein
METVLTEKLKAALLEELDGYLTRSLGRKIEATLNVQFGTRDVTDPLRESHSRFEHNGRSRLTLEIAIGGPGPIDDTPNARPTPCGCQWHPDGHVMLVTCAFHADLAQRLVDALKS